MTTAAMPAADVDLFADPVLADPYPAYRVLRDAGPAVYLPGYRVWVLARDREVRHALDHPEVFAATRPAGLFDGLTAGEAVRAPAWPACGHARARSVDGRPGEPAQRAAGGLLGGAVPAHRVPSDPAEPSACAPGARSWDESLRTIAAHRSLRTFAGLQAFITDQAERIVDDLVAYGSFDAVTELAHRFPLKTIGTLIGLPAESRPDLLLCAEASLQAHGPLDDHTVRALLDLEHVFALLVAELAAARAPEPAVLPTPTASVTAPVRRGGGTTPPDTFAAPPSGDVLGQAAIAHLLSSFAMPCVHTVAAGLTGMLWLLATHPGAWHALRADPSLVPAAVEESLRLETPVQTCARTTTRDVRIGDALIREGERVLLLLGAANRDPRKWPAPDRFDPHRNPTGHFVNGTQPTLARALAKVHLCAVLDALARRASHLYLDGRPRRRLTVGTRTFASLPLYVSAG
ncbi:hypothetical protein GCM10010106_27950 [Thermopolyspora flexuosa]|uniref:Cytochrome P450 n=1 Tax=Thermopolyspora flexuosa TaxID=103836 RepID=A0A543IWD8_9ACTN|nr:cytochrome P450 [Thermopolyspora flexuosa]TQM74894.1 hypothetical protein FHX40_1580 [Thermopolyspora flexuosa]GGM79749.1 hypothetical protein GCM10010106_27950 [Thermopolyspora flexuosa]